MDTSVVTALAALAGAAIGGLTSIVASWLNQRAQAKTEQLSHYQLVWAAGIRASCSFNESGLELNRAGPHRAQLVGQGRAVHLRFWGTAPPWCRRGQSDHYRRPPKSPISRRCIWSATYQLGCRRGSLCRHLASATSAMMSGTAAMMRLGTAALVCRGTAALKFDLCRGRPAKSTRYHGPQRYASPFGL